MNAADMMLLERMQQMAASMAVPQIGGGQSVQPKTTKDGASFQDLMDRAQSAKDNSTASSKPQEQDQKTEQVEEKAPAQEVKGKPVFKDDPRVKEMDPHTQAMVAAGIAALTELEDGTIVVAIPASELPCVTMTALQPNGEPDLSQPVVLQTGSGQVFKVWLDGEEPVVEQTVLTPEETARFQDALVQQTRQTEDGAETVVLQKDAPRAETQTEDNTRSGQEDQTGEEDKVQVTVTREPLFKAFEGTPIKVGENFQTVDTQAADMDAQLAQAIQQAAQSGEQSMIIKLTPENLGNLTIQLTQSGDGALQVVLHASSAKAAGLLSQHLDSLNLALQNLNNAPVRVEVQRHEDSQQAQQHAFQQADPDGHNQQQRQQQQRRQEESRSDDFIQQLRLGLFSLEDII